MSSVVKLLFFSHLNPPEIYLHLFVVNIDVNANAVTRLVDGINGRTGLTTDFV